jgi:flagellin-specific chaperone FliS
MSTTEEFKRLFETCTDKIQPPQNQREVNVYDAMDMLKKHGVEAINNCKDLLDAGLLKTLKSIVVIVWDNIDFTVRYLSLDYNDPDVVTALSHITNIATATQSIQATLNRDAEQRDRDSLPNLFERCTANLMKPNAKKTQEAYDILDKLRREAYDYFHEQYDHGQSRTTLNVINVLDEFMQTTSTKLVELNTKIQDKSQITIAQTNLASIQNAVNKIRKRQAERQRQDTSNPIDSLYPAKAPLTQTELLRNEGEPRARHATTHELNRVRRSNNKPVDKKLNMSELLMQLKNAADTAE